MSKIYMERQQINEKNKKSNSKMDKGMTDNSQKGKPK